MIFKTDTEDIKNECIGMVQIHSANVCIVSIKDIGKDIPNCDGLITNDPEVCLKVSVADCIPLALSDKNGKCIGLIHAGWRGLSKGIIKNAIGLMHKKFGINPYDLNAEIGPHICWRHYPIGDDLVRIFSDYTKAIKTDGDKSFLSLKSVALQQLIKCGVKRQNIKVSKMCTFENISLPSYRRGDMKRRIYYVLKS